MKHNFFQMREAASKEVEDTLEDTLAEATNWKGTDHLSLTRYAAGKGVGYGLQITQNKRMGNDKFRMGAHVSMPLKDVPKLVKSLMKVYNDKGSQLGDNESVKVEDDVISEDATAALKKKAEKSGMPLGILRQVFNRGKAAWRTGHRPGTNPDQWGHARVNSFVTKSSGTWGKADKDLAAKVRGSKSKNESLLFTVPETISEDLPGHTSYRVSTNKLQGNVSAKSHDHAAEIMRKQHKAKGPMTISHHPHSPKYNRDGNNTKTYEATKVVGMHYGKNAKAAAAGMKKHGGKIHTDPHGNHTLMYDKPKMQARGRDALVQKGLLPKKVSKPFSRPIKSESVDQTEDMDNKMFVLRKQAQANQRRIDKGMKPYTPLHPDHKNLIKPMKKKPLTNKQFVANKQAAINKKRMGESIGQTPGDHSYHYLQKAKRLAANDGHDYDKLPAYDRTHNKHKDYYDQKARSSS